MSHEPFFFLHFPRTAGTTIDDIFFNNYPQEKIIKIYSKGEFEKYRTITEDQFENTDYITGHLLLSSLNPTQFYGRNVRAFTFLREPVKRLFSEYVFLKTWKNQHLYEYLNSGNISFSEYVTSREKLLKYRGKNFTTRCLSGDSLEETDISASLEKAKYNLEHSFICFGIQERFMESLLLLSAKANLKKILHQKRNSLNYAVASPEMTEEEKQIAREHNQADIELYNFATELFDRRVRDAGPQFKEDLKNFIFLNSKYQKISALLREKKTGRKSGQDAIELSKDSQW